MRPLVWFRSDLRVQDNPAFAAAIERAKGPVAAVFLVAKDQWREHDWGEAKKDFVLRNVEALRHGLSGHGVLLHTIDAPRFADAAEALLALARAQGCDTLLFNREYEWNEARRDEAVAAAFTAAGLAVEATDDQTVLPPGLLRTGSGQFFRVFTPFRRAWLAAVHDRLPLKMAKVAGPTARHMPPAERNSRWSTLWPAGEAEAQRRLRAFLRDRAGRYQDDRNFPALDGTSALSPYLAAGVISARQCLLAAMKANGGKLEGGDVNIDTWISELIWREFYRHVMVGFPRVCKHQPFKLETAKIRWRGDDAGFAAWCEGRTGYPIVDAGMRQLRETGWMHNRLRMITAMFLTKDLLIDWRRGERFFVEHLIDGDLASNNGGWQWSASTGSDAVPYFRIFNPVTQSERFDPRGEFIRRYVPELRGLDDKAVHDPSRLPPLARQALDYPEPIVDHAEARQRALAAFAGLSP